MWRGEPGPVQAVWVLWNRARPGARDGLLLELRRGEPIEVPALRLLRHVARDGDGDAAIRHRADARGRACRRPLPLRTPTVLSPPPVAAPPPPPAAALPVQEVRKIVTLSSPT